MYYKEKTSFTVMCHAFMLWTLFPFTLFGLALVLVGFMEVFYYITSN